ncbi:MAG: helix-turn-helix domain-containing protein [Firmicutes bacterium]|nr:helix-turn-helix domain-containing protein [Bacillota bacterium]
MTFGEKIRELRRQAGLSQGELGDAVQVTLRTVRGWETEGRCPKKHITYVRLAEVFGCKVSSLMSDHPLSEDASAEETAADPAAGIRTIMDRLEELFTGSALTGEEKLSLVTEIQMLYLNSIQNNN